MEAFTSSFTKHNPQSHPNTQFARTFVRASCFVYQGGAGGSRTRVQTRKPYAFYTLIPDLVFVPWQDLDHQPRPYLLKFHRRIGAYADYSRFYCAAGPGRFGTTSPERRLVQSPCNRIEPVIYCASIRQREHTNCCQLIFRPNGLRSTQPSLRVLTYHFYPLSNPVNPF